MAPFAAGETRVSLVAARGFDYDGGHDEEHGISPQGEVIEVPLHRHEVSMDLTELQLTVQHVFSHRWIGTLRVPFSNRSQATGVIPVDPATPEDITAMDRNGFIHHRNETFRGLGDPRILLGWQHSPALREGDLFFSSFGLTVPLGATEDDPWVAGAAGEKHTHPQIGTGTVDPLVEIRYGIPIQPRLSLHSGLQLRWPVYENAKTYRGAPDLRVDLSGLAQIYGRWLGLFGYDVLYQGYSHWDGARDPNSGIVSQSVRLGVSTGVLGVGVQLSGYVPVAQRLLQDGDGFEQGPTIVLGVSRAM